jgi:hypothetical protein
MFRRLSLFVVVATVTLVTPLQAEKVDMSPEALRETATHVITGQVTAVYVRTEVEAGWRYTKYVAEIRVASLEKGDGIRKGSLLYARYWRRRWIGKGPVGPSTGGHRGLPSKGESLRVYLARNAYDGFSSKNQDGGFNVIGANGFQRLKAKADK